MRGSRVLLPIAAMIAWSVGALPAGAQDFPTKPVRILTGAPGTGIDIVSRTIATQLEAKWGRSAIVVNQGGMSGGAVAVSALLNAPADGHSLIVQSSAFATLFPLVVTKSTYRPSDLEPVGILASDTIMLVSAPQGRVKSIDDIRQIVRQPGGEVRYGTLGVGSSGHVIGVAIGNRVGGTLIHIPYRDYGNLVRDLTAGDIDLFFAGGGSVFRQVIDGALHGVAVSDDRRRGCVPEVKTLTEQGIEIHFSNWIGAFAATGTPTPIVQRLNADINAILKTDKSLQTFATMCLAPQPTSPREFAEMMRRDIATWNALLAGADIKID